MLCVFSIIFLQALAVIEVEVKSHEYLFPGQLWTLHLTAPVDPDECREHIMWGEISKSEWLLCKSLIKPSGGKTKDRVQQFTADIAAFCKKKWDQCLHPDLSKLCQSVFDKDKDQAEGLKRGPDAPAVGDEPDKKKKKKDSKDKEKEGGKKKDNKKDKKDEDKTASDAAASAGKKKEKKEKSKTK